MKGLRFHKLRRTKPGRPYRYTSAKRQGMRSKNYGRRK